MTEAAEPDAHDTRSEVRPSRRRMLRLAGVGAAAGAGAVLLSESSASATQGSAVLAGDANSATDTTSITATTTSNLPVLEVIQGSGSTGAGLVAEGASWVDVKCFGTGRLGQAPATGLTGSAQPSWSTISGIQEIARSDTGIIWATQGSGAPSGWARINAVRVDAANGSGAAFSPTRILDTRTTGGAKAAGSHTTVNVAGVGGVPSNAIAIFANLTAVAPGSKFPAPGFLTVYPQGTSQPTVSNFDVAPISGMTTLSNFFVCGLGGGELIVFNSVATNFLIDVFAYIQ